MSTLLRLASLPFRERPKVGVTPADVVLRENKMKVLCYRPRPEVAQRKTPVLMVPSLINRHYVLDLLPGKSFTEYLLSQGHPVYVIDWGTPGPEDRFLGLEHYVVRYLGRAVRSVSRRHGGESVHLFGYCLGGTLAVMHAALRPERVASLSLVAAPVRFADDGLLSRWTRSKTFDIDAVVEACGNVPWQLLQSAFHLLRPTLPLSKAASVIKRAWDDQFLDGFFALETWGNDNVAFPGECYRRYLKDLYRSDLLIKGELDLGGELVRLDAITCPLLAVTFEHDNIVPKESARALLDHIRTEEPRHLHVPGGHVGAMVSKSAARGLWPQLSQFWCDLETPTRSGRQLKAVAQPGKA